MTSASVALHESNLSLHADTFVLRWMCVHHGKVTRHRKPDEWWITCACAKAGRQCAAASEGPAVASQPCQPLRLADATISAQPSVPGPSHLRRQTACRREITHSRWGHLLWLAHPSIVSLSHVTYSCFLVETLQDRAFQFWVRHKKGRGWGKADIASLRSGSNSLKGPAPREEQD